jgi:hypothetical protein
MNLKKPAIPAGTEDAEVLSIKNKSSGSSWKGHFGYSVNDQEKRGQKSTNSTSVKFSKLGVYSSAGIAVKKHGYF